MVVVEGRLVSKRKRAEWIVLTLEQETKGDDNDDDNSCNEVTTTTTTTTVYVPRTTTTTTRPLFSTQSPSLDSSANTDSPSSDGTIPSFVFYLQGVLRVCG
jgi:hypothetical protein